MTRAELRTQIGRGLNDTGGVFVTPDQANLSIDEAMEVMAEESGLVRRSAFLPLQPGTLYYPTTAIASDVMMPVRLWLVGEERRLRAISLRELARRHDTWPTVQRTPEHWFPVSWDLFGLWPSPAAGGGIIRVDYLAWPRALLDDSDEPEFQFGDQDAIVEYGIYDGLAKRWDVMQMLNTWSRFGARVGFSRARTGASRVQARGFQVEATE